MAVRFRLFNTSVCFVNSHLAAHQDEVDRRNQVRKEFMERRVEGRERDGMK